ncbi:MAG: SGNH/GDSL hydrolase family protein [Phycisphaerae bacterium]
MFIGGAFGYIADYGVWLTMFASVLVHTWCFFKFFPRRRYRRTGMMLGNALVFACMLGAVALVAETYLRFMSVATDSFGVTLPARRWFALYTDLNALGCRDRAWSMDKPPDVRRIAFVGDSFTYGWGVKRVEDRFTDMLQRRFDEATEERVEVMNVAKPGWDTGDEIQPIAAMIRAYGVDEIVLCYVINDIERLLPTSDDFDPKRPPQSQIFNTDSSMLVEYLYYRVVVPRKATVRRYEGWLADGYADAGTWRRQRQRLGAIMDLCRKHDVTFRVVLMPLLRTGTGRLDQAAIHEQLTRVFRAREVPLIDLLPVVSAERAEDLVVSGADAHPNERAHRMFADAIWRAFYATGGP